MNDDPAKRISAAIIDPDSLNRNHQTSTGWLLTVALRLDPHL